MRFTKLFFTSALILAIGLLGSQASFAGSSTIDGLFTANKRVQSMIEGLATKLDRVDQQLDLNAAQIASLAKAFDSGADPNVIKAKLSVVKSQLGALTASVDGASAGLVASRIKLVQIKAAAGLFKSPPLKAAIGKSFMILDDAEGGAVTAKQKVSDSRDAIDDLESQL